MSKINVDTWEPESGTAATLMASGDTVTVPSGATLAIASGATIANSGTATGFSAGFHGVSTPATGTGAWSRPAGVTKIIVEVQAGGGGGSGSTASAYGGNSGAGAYAKKFIDVTSISSADIVVGAAGAGGASAVGTAGGTSSFICTGHSISCTGGQPGQYNIAHGDGGAGGVATASGAFMLVNGQNGGQSYSYGDQGGDSVLGLGGMNTDYSTASSAPYPATGYGAGGAGGKGSHVSYYGSDGSVGIVIVWEYK